MNASPQDIVEALLQHPTTNMMAASAVISPWWLPYLQTASDTATLLLPIAGLAWLVIQMIVFVRKNKK